MTAFRLIKREETAFKDIAQAMARFRERTPLGPSSLLQFNESFALTVREETDKTHSIRRLNTTRISHNLVACARWQQHARRSVWKRKIITKNGHKTSSHQNTIPSKHHPIKTPSHPQWIIHTKDTKAQLRWKNVGNRVGKSVALCSGVEVDQWSTDLHMLNVDEQLWCGESFFSFFFCEKNASVDRRCTDVWCSARVCRIDSLAERLRGHQLREFELWWSERYPLAGRRNRPKLPERGMTLINCAACGETRYDLDQLCCVWWNALWPWSIVPRVVEFFEGFRWPLFRPTSAA